MNPSTIQAAGGMEEQELTNPLRSGQLCLAVKNFGGQEEGDLPFTIGDKLWIVKPCELMFWYIARNESGKSGMVPSNFIKPAAEGASTESSFAKEASASASTKPIEASKNTVDTGESDTTDGYIRMNPKVIKEARQADMEVEMAQMKETRRRLQAGTLVVATRPFLAQERADLSFSIYEEMTILKPLPDLCWYHAQKMDDPTLTGAIPITHVRLVYMSDDEEESSSASEMVESSHDRLYDDMNDFISHSGWFSYPGLPHSKEALHRVLAKKCKMSYTEFMACREAVYKLDYTNGEKIFIDKAEVLHVELTSHFDQFGQQAHTMREIDQELCHHTGLAGWDLTVWPLEKDMDLEVECAKKIIEGNSLISKDGGSGLSDRMSFKSKASFDKFWDWFSPPK